jgi:hypothetical protein
VTTKITNSDGCRVEARICASSEIFLGKSWMDTRAGQVPKEESSFASKNPAATLAEHVQPSFVVAGLLPDTPSLARSRHRDRTYFGRHVIFP